MVGPLKNIYIYRTTPVTWTLKGNKKQFEGRFQWNLDEGNRNLVQVSEELKLSEFKLSGFFCIIIIIIQLANQVEKFSDMLSPEVCALADYTSQPWMMSTLQASHKCEVEIFTIHSPKSSKTNPSTVKSYYYKHWDQGHISWKSQKLYGPNIKYSNQNIIKGSGFIACKPLHFVLSFAECRTVETSVLYVNNNGCAGVQETDHGLSVSLFVCPQVTQAHYEPVSNCTSQLTGISNGNNFHWLFSKYLHGMAMWAWATCAL